MHECKTVTLRTRPLKGRMMSFYLDYYPGYRDKETMKVIRHESLGIYIYANPRNKREQNFNEVMTEKAEAIRCRRFESVVNERYDFFDKYKLKADFLEYYRKQLRKHDQKWEFVYLHFSNFVHGKCTFEEIDIDLCNKFREYLLSAKKLRRNGRITRNSASGYWSTFRGFLKILYRNGMIKTNVNDFLEKIETEDVVKEYLSVEELYKLAETPCKKPILKIASLFSCMTSLRISDILALCWEDIVDYSAGGKCVHIVTQKNKAEDIIPISEEALELIGGNNDTVEEMKLWLLKQKQTQQWNSPVATADAVYALLMKGVNLLDNQGDVRIVIADEVLETVSPSKTTVPGLGYIKRSFTQKNVVDARKIEVEKRNPGIAWGAVYAEYESPVSDVRQQGGELNVQKQLYVERMVNNAPQLQPVTEKTVLQVGDKIVSRLSIRVDRPMDFVQLKDQRGACFEPIGSVSGYNWSNGIGYYVDIKDASTNFFFDHLGKGVYVLEYGYRISRAGTYETGLATMQCAYAPEYASHSASMTIIIK